MNEIAELERRITAALDRIGRAVEDGLRAGSEGATAAHDEDLREALETERAANAQLTERVRAIKEKQETIVTGLERSVRRLTEELEATQAELHRQKRAAQELIDANRALEQSGGGEASAINRAMQAELEALRAARSSERAELAGIIAELRPLIGEVA
jgi:peptidoglycan hydrolase CwlO-like protein